MIYLENLYHFNLIKGCVSEDMLEWFVSRLNWYIERRDKKYLFAYIESHIYQSIDYNRMQRFYKLKKLQEHFMENDI